MELTFRIQWETSEGLGTRNVTEISQGVSVISHLLITTKAQRRVDTDHTGVGFNPVKAYHSSKKLISHVVPEFVHDGNNIFDKVAFEDFDSPRGDHFNAGANLGMALFRSLVGEFNTQPVDITERQPVSQAIVSRVALIKNSIHTITLQVKDEVQVDLGLHTSLDHTLFRSGYKDHRIVLQESIPRCAFYNKEGCTSQRRGIEDVPRLISLVVGLLCHVVDWHADSVDRGLALSMRFSRRCSSVHPST